MGFAVQGVSCPSRLCDAYIVLTPEELDVVRLEGWESQSFGEGQLQLEDNSRISWHGDASHRKQLTPLGLSVNN